MNCRRRRWNDCSKTATSGSCATGSFRNIDTPFTPAALHEILEGRLGLSSTTSLVVAYSGGCDSHALLHALHSLRLPHLRAVHVDHGLQPAAREWSAHCLNVCRALSIPCAVERIEVVAVGEESTEAAARRLRYERLASHLNPADVLLTAHHQDDQAETVMLQLLRGAGAHGLAAMPPIARFGVARHARPLLGFSRAALTNYARAQALEWIEDLSNRDDGLSRNFLRARVLPLLQQRWPAAARVMARAAANSADIAALLDDVATEDHAACASADDEEQLIVSAVRQLSSARQRNLVRFWIRRHGFQPPSALHLEQILQQIAHPSESGLSCIDWPGVEVHRYRDALAIRARTPPPPTGLELTWQPPQALEIPETGWRLRAVATTGAGLSQARLAGNALSVRLRRGGETCRLAGHAHHQQLKKLLQEAGVPPWERERLPLIYVGDELAAIGERWVCMPYAAQPDEPGWRIVLESLR